MKALLARALYWAWEKVMGWIGKLSGRNPGG